MWWPQKERGQDHRRIIKLIDQDQAGCWQLGTRSTCCKLIDDSGTAEPTYTEITAESQQTAEVASNHIITS